MSMRPPVIAHRTLICRPAGEAEREVVVRIRAPVPEAGRWLCEAELEHLYRDVARARGVDSLQALQLALETVRITLASLLEAGGSIHWGDGSAMLSTEDLLR